MLYPAFSPLLPEVNFRFSVFFFFFSISFFPGPLLLSFLISEFLAVVGRFVFIDVKHFPYSLPVRGAGREPAMQACPWVHFLSNYVVLNEERRNSTLKLECIIVNDVQKKKVFTLQV